MMKVQRLLSVHGILRLLLAVLLATSANLTNANDLQTETHVIPTGSFDMVASGILGRDATGRFIAFSGVTSANQFIAAQRLDESGAPIGEPIKLVVGNWLRSPRIAVSDGWGIAYQIFERGVDGSQSKERVIVRETLEGPEKELAVDYEQHRKSSLVYHYPLVGWLQSEPSSTIVDSLASVDLTKGTNLVLEAFPSSFFTDGNRVRDLRAADFAAVVRRFNASTGLHEIWIRPLFSSWTRISDPGLFSGSKVVTGGPWVAWYEHGFGAPETYSLKAYNHLTNDYRLVVARSDDTFFDGPYSATLEYLVYASKLYPDPVESYLYRFEDNTIHLLAQGVQHMGSSGSASILGDMVAFPDFLSRDVTVVKFAECIDDDGDGVCLELDMCPSQDATGFDIDADGCIDSHDGLADLIGTLVLEGVIEATMQTRLNSTLGSANASTDRDNLCAAINTLEAFKNQVLSQTGRKISLEAAELVIAYADSVIASLTASLPTGTTCY